MNHTTVQKPNLSGLDKKDFQRSIDGKKTDLFILRNKKGMEIAATNYGAAILAIMAPDRQGHYANVILGHDNIEDVIHIPEPFLSTTIGRYGNRIAKGRFTLDGKTYTLAVNNGPNSLHGGPKGFHAAVWEAEQTAENAVAFRHTSPDGDEGFPGCLSVLMTYTLDDDNALTIHYEATTDKKTIVNLTNHGFFNLAGIGCPTPSAEGHVVTIHADFYIPTDDVSIPTGEIAKVEGTPMDFRTPHAIGERINDAFQQLKFGAGYDHCYVLDKREPGELSFAARCVDPGSGRCMEVYTTEPGLQLYTGNWLNGFSGTHGATYPARSAVCFEAQHFPDSPNRPYFPSAGLEPGGKYTQTTVYKFGTEPQD